MTVYNEAGAAFRRQAKAIRRRGLVALVCLLVIVTGLLYLMFGNSFTPLPFELDRSPLDDKNFVLGGLSVPAVVARVAEKALAAVVCIYLIQVVLMFLRYFWRLAEHLDLCASVIEMSDGSSAELTANVAALLPASIDFGRAPRSPLENVAQTLASALQETITKMPQR